ncbi:hypothetical protein MJD09_23475 [bacterium]|nr:hypothetical protein [bacterium]
MRKASKSHGQLINVEDACPSSESNFGGCAAPPNPKLIAEGWERRFVADARMALDAKETYLQLGYEVKLESLATSYLKDECSGCHILLKDFSVVYTRKLKED